MYVKAWVSLDPLILWRADDIPQREGVIQTLHLRQVEVSVVDVVVDSYEDLSLTSIHHGIVLGGGLASPQSAGDWTGTYPFL